MDHWSVTLRRVFTKRVLDCLNIGPRQSCYDSQSTVARPPATVAWPIQRLFSKVSQIAWNVQKRCLHSQADGCVIIPTTVKWPFSDFLPQISNCIKGRKVVCSGRLAVQLRDFRPLSRDRSATVSKWSQISWNVQGTLLSQSADGRVTSEPLSRDRSASVCPNFPKSLFETSNTRRFWQSADGRVTSDQLSRRPLSDFFQDVC